MKLELNCSLGSVARVMLRRGPAVLAPTITGDGSLAGGAFRVGVPLTITAGTATAANGGAISYAFRYRTGGTVLAETAGYTPVTGDVGDVIVAEWRAIEAGGRSTLWQSVGQGEVLAALTAPEITELTSSIDDRTITITASATGNPTPTLELTALTLGGVDVLSDATGTGPWTYVVPDSASSQTVACTVTATNSEGTDTASGSRAVAGDATAPIINSVTVSALAADTLPIALSMTEGGTVFYVLVPNGATAPTPAEILAEHASGGGSPSAGGSFAATTAGTYNETVNGLNGLFDLYAVVRDAAGNVSSVASANVDLLYSPSDLFVGNEGVWLDPSDISTLFQDTSGTVPVTAPGQSVARANDKSGNNNHATQATAAARPTYQVDANGRGYLSFDGVDDFMVTPTITPGIDKAQVFAGVRKLSDVVRVLIGLGPNINTSNGSFEILTRYANPNSEFGFVSRGTSLKAAEVDNDAFLAPTSNVLTCLGDISGDLAVLRIDGTQVAQNVGDQGTGNYLGYPVYIGARAGTALFFKSQLYSLVVRFGPNLTAPEIEEVEGYVANKTGVTL